MVLCVFNLDLARIIMGLALSFLTVCARCWDAGDTHILISPAGGWTHARPKILFYEKHKPYYEFTNFSA